jgi:hypothetical protein
MPDTSQCLGSPPLHTSCPGIVLALTALYPLPGAHRLWSIFFTTGGEKLRPVAARCRWSVRELKPTISAAVYRLSQSSRRQGLISSNIRTENSSASAVSNRCSGQRPGRRETGTDVASNPAGREIDVDAHPWKTATPCRASRSAPVSGALVSNLIAVGAKFGPRTRRTTCSSNNRLLQSERRRKASPRRLASEVMQTRAKPFSCECV